MSSHNEIEFYKKYIKNKISSHINNGQLKEALELAKEYEKIIVNDVEIYHAKSIIYIKEGEYELAEITLKQAINLDANNGDTYYNLAYLYQLLNKSNESYKYYNLAKEYSNNIDMINSIEEILNNKEFIGNIEKHEMMSKHNSNVLDDDRNRKKVLIIAYIFPPLGGSGVQRTLKFVKYLRDFGWEPVVVTVESFGFKSAFKDNTLEKELPNDIEIIRIKTPADITPNYINKIIQLYQGMTTNNKIIEEYITYTNKTQQLILVPDNQIIFAYETIVNIFNLVKMNEIDLIYTTSGPYSDHIIGYYLKKKYFKPWVADFRDEWSNNPYIQFDENNIHHKLGLFLENEIVHFADKVINVNPMSTMNYKKLFQIESKKLETITNGYDETDFLNLDSTIAQQNECFSVFHNGLFYSIRTPKTIIQAVENLINKGKIDKEKFKLDLGWIENKKEWDEHIRNRDLEDIVFFGGYLEHRESLEKAQRMDALLLVVGPGEKNKAMYPGKLFEYLRLNKPILSLSPNGSVVDKLIDKLEAGVNVDFNNVNAIEQALLQMYNDWDRGVKGPKELNVEVKSFDRRNLTQKLANVFNEVVDSSSDIKNEVQKLNDQKFIEKYYLQRFGREIDLQNPKTFSEKIQWIKLNYRNNLMTRCADKFEVRDYIKEKNLDYILNDIYGVYDAVSEIDLSKLPNEFVLKATHGSGWNSICYNKESLNWKDEFKKIEEWLNTNYYNIGREWVYKNIKPRIICEKLLIDEESSLPKDYRFFCFNGQPKLIQVDVDQSQGRKRNIYDINWNKMAFEHGFPMSKSTHKKPKNLSLMIEIAEKLSEDFPFVRVDLYNINGKIYFGELTFYPGNGFGVFKPDVYDSVIGSYLDLSNLAVLKRD